MDFRQRTRQEIARDVRVTAAGFAHELVKTAVASLERAALSDSDPDVARLFDEVDALVSRFRNHHRDLSNARAGAARGGAAVLVRRRLFWGL
jgi:ABC-type transporter Mla subunit MlaD